MPVRLSVRSKLSRECEAMTMSRQSADTISSNWSHDEEGRESGLDIKILSG